jgi:hypothetical protein
MEELSLRVIRVFMPGPILEPGSCSYPLTAGQ